MDMLHALGQVYGSNVAIVVVDGTHTHIKIYLT